MGDNSYLTNDDIIYGLKNREQPCLKTLYDDYSAQLLGIISLVITNEKMKLEILEKTFIHIGLEIKTYNPIHSTIFIWMIKVAISVSAKYMDVPISEMQNKFHDAYKSLRTSTQQKKR